MCMSWYSKYAQTYLFIYLTCFFSFSFFLKCYVFKFFVEVFWNKVDGWAFSAGAWLSSTHAEKGRGQAPLTAVLCDAFAVRTWAQSDHWPFHVYRCKKITKPPISNNCDLFPLILGYSYLFFFFLKAQWDEMELLWFVYVFPLMTWN